MANKKNKLNKQQKKLVKQIMKENSPQRRVDEWVEQAKAEQLKAEQEKAEKLAIEIWNREANQQTKVDKWVAEELAKMTM